MVDLVKFLMHLRLCGILQHDQSLGARLTDGAPFSKILGPGPPALPGVMSPVQQAYTEYRNGAQTRQTQTGFTILCHYLSVIRYL